MVGNVGRPLGRVIQQTGRQQGPAKGPSAYSGMQAMRNVSTPGPSSMSMEPPGAAGGTNFARAQGQHARAMQQGISGYQSRSMHTDSAGGSEGAGGARGGSSPMPVVDKIHNAKTAKSELNKLRQMPDGKIKNTLAKELVKEARTQKTALMKEMRKTMAAMKEAKKEGDATAVKEFKAKFKEQVNAFGGLNKFAATASKSHNITQDKATFPQETGRSRSASFSAGSPTSKDASENVQEYTRPSQPSPQRSQSFSGESGQIRQQPQSPPPRPSSAPPSGGQIRQQPQAQAAPRPRSQSAPPPSNHASASRSSSSSGSVPIKDAFARQEEFAKEMINNIRDFASAEKQMTKVNHMQRQIEMNGPVRKEIGKQGRAEIAKEKKSAEQYKKLAAMETNPEFKAQYEASAKAAQARAELLDSFIDAIRG